MSSAPSRRRSRSDVLPISDRLRPAVGNLPPLLARTVDVDDIVEQWRRLRESMAPPPSEPPAPATVTALVAASAPPLSPPHTLAG